MKQNNMPHKLSLRGLNKLRRTLNRFFIFGFIYLLFVMLFFLFVLISPAIFVDYDDLINAFFSRETLYALSLSLVTSTIASLLTISLALPSAYVLSRHKFKGKEIVEGLLDVPISIPPVALGASLLIFFARSPLGHFIDERILRVIFEIPGIIVAQFAVTVPVAIKVLKEVFDGIPLRTDLVARTLGYSQTEVFLRIVLPMAKRGIVATSLLSWAKALGEFGATIMLAGATRFKTETLPIALYLRLVEGDLGGMAIIIYILVIIALVITLVTRKLVLGRKIV